MRYHGIFWLLLLSSFLLVSTYAFISTGGHFISFFHTIVPVAFLLAAFVHVFRGYSVETTSQRQRSSLFKKIERNHKI